MKNKRSEFTVHALLLVVLIVIPLLVQLESSQLSLRYMNHFWIMVLGLLVTFYSNYLFAIEELLYKKRFVLFVVFNILIFVLNDSVENFFNAVMMRDVQRAGNWHTSGAMQTMFLYNRFIFAALGVGTSLAVRYYKRLVDIEDEREKLAKEKLVSEISMLKYQMQPHFFFNSLNNIYALIGKSPQDAQKAVHSLSKMMRYVLYENMGECDCMPLDKEIDFVRNYNKLMLLRIGDGMRVNLSAPDETQNVSIPPLLLIPLVENAYKHGREFIDGQLSLTDDRVIFRVENGLAHDEQEDRSCSGIGLQNLKKRLGILYGDKASLVAMPTDHDSFVAQLELPLKKE